MDMTLGERIRKARKGKMTQAELGEAIGVHEVTVRRWELGERVPDAADLQRIASVLGVSASELLGELENEPSENLINGKDSLFKKTANALVYERNGERMELPPTEQSYAIFRELALKMATREISQPVMGGKSVALAG